MVLACALLATLSVVAEGAKAGWVLQLTSPDRVVVVRDDGTQPREGSPLPGKLSPDGSKRILEAQMEGRKCLCLAGADGSKPVKLLEPEDYRHNFDQGVHWLPDSRHVVFASRGETGKWQIIRMNPSDGDKRPLTAEPSGATDPRVTPEGKISYLALRSFANKVWKADLVLLEDQRAKVLVKDTVIWSHAWSPDGKWLAYSTLDSMIFRELATGKENVINYQQRVHKDLYAHAAGVVKWRPDSQTVACTINFLGGRRVIDNEVPYIFGDQEVFIIGTDGSSRWFQPKEKFNHIDWVPDRGQGKQDRK